MTVVMIAQMSDEGNNEDRQTPSDFSIEHILNRAGNSVGSSYENCSESSRFSFPLGTLSWLQCSRYCPPRVPRTSKREGQQQKRQLGRHPRIPFTSHQLSILEEKYKQSPYLSSEEVMALSKQLQLADVRVKIWFQNRRARERRERPGGSRVDTASPPQTASLRLSPQYTETSTETTSISHSINPFNCNNILIPPSIIMPDFRQFSSQLTNLVPNNVFQTNTSQKDGT